MSYDLTIKPDDEFSRAAAVGRVLAFAAQLPHLRPNGARGFVLDDPPSRWMEIDLEFIGSDGEFDAALTNTGPDTNCINLHIPYAYLGEQPERDYFPTALALARFLGWRLYDEQSGEDIKEGAIPRRQWTAFYRQVMQALGEE
jgi:hypothetical protein